MTKFALVLLGLALVLATAPALGAGRRIALLNGDPELQRELTLALSAWDIETVPLDLQLSESDAEARMQAAELARNLHLEAVVWVSLTADGSRLAVFDVHTGELTLRNFREFPPFASTTAAGLALSVKTALRPSVEQASEPPAPRAPAPVLRKPKPAERIFEPPNARASLRALFDVAWVAENKAEPRLGLGTTLWFGQKRHWGAALRLSAGSGVDVNAAGFAGRYRDLTLTLGGEWRWLNAGSVSSALGLGGALRAAILDGTLSGNNQIAVLRYDPGVDAAFRLDVRLAGAWFFGVDASACFFTHYERFLVAGRPIFAPFRLSPSLGASLGIALF